VASQGVYSKRQQGQTSPRVRNHHVHLHEAQDAESHPEYTISTDFLVSAVGQLNQPKWPDIEGLDAFQGKKMHSARWDWSYDLKDKKIAMIGNGRMVSQP